MPTFDRNRLTRHETRAPTPTSGGTSLHSGAGKDPRITALRRFAVSITVFTLLGHMWLGFEQAYATPVVAVLTAYFCEFTMESLEAKLSGRPPRYTGSWGALVNFLLPAHIAGLACAMLLYGNARLAPTVFAVTVAIVTKYLVRVKVGGRPRHVLNPSNFGISLTLLAFPWVSIAPPYEFTENVNGVFDWVIPLAVLTSGSILNGRLTRRMPLISAWIAGFAAQAVVRHLVTGDALVGALLPLAGTAFILFTNYMITDPGTTPIARRGQIAFGLATAATYGLLVHLHVVFGLFFSLTVVCVARGAGLAIAHAWQGRARVARVLEIPRPVASLPNPVAPAHGTPAESRE